MIENIPLYKATTALENNTGIQSLFLDKSTDDQVQLQLIKEGSRQSYTVYVERQPTRAQLAVLISSFQKKKGVQHTKLLIVSRFVSPTLAEFLKSNHCNFIDTVGNAYVNFDSVFVYITGFKRPPVQTATKPSRAFQTTGLKLIFNLLCHPEELINRNYRDLSDLTGVSLGSIGWIINDLKEAGYLGIDGSNKRRWLNKNDLIKRWVVAYAEKLRPKLMLGYYRSLQEGWQDDLDISAYGAQWGGELAADQLTHYLKPELSTVYIEDQLGKLVLMNGLKEVSEKKHRNVEVLQKFWRFENHDNPKYTPALLVYADLIASGDSRNLETADIIFEGYLSDVD